MASPTDNYAGNALRDVLAARQATEDLIRSEGRLVALWRAPDTADDGTGGRFRPGTDPGELAAKRRFYAIVRNQPLQAGQPLVGEELKERFVLVGSYDDDIQKGDFFYVGNRRHDILYVDANQSYEIRANGEVVTDGGKI